MMDTETEKRLILKADQWDREVPPFINPWRITLAVQRNPVVGEILRRGLGLGDSDTPFRTCWHCGRQTCTVGKCLYCDTSPLMERERAD